MIPYPRRLLPFLLCSGLALALTLGMGCSDAPHAAAVDAPQARVALRDALEGWKQGQPPAALRAGSPPIVVQDLDWESGHRLLDYRVLDDGKDDDANLRIPVELILRDPRGREVPKRVRYVVGTSPVITVFREFF